MWSTSCCHSAHSSSLTELYSKLPPPMLSEVFSQKRIEKCYMGEDFKALENGVQVSAASCALK